MRKMIWQGQARAYRDAEVKTSAKGTGYAKIPVMIDVEEAEQGAARDERPSPLFGALMVFGKSADPAAQTNKGDVVMFMGEAERRTWQADDGPREHWTILCSAFTALGSEAGNGQQRQRQAPQRQAPARQAAPTQRRQQVELTEDDIPF